MLNFEAVPPQSEIDHVDEVQNIIDIVRPHLDPPQRDALLHRSKYHKQKVTEKDLLQTVADTAEAEFYITDTTATIMPPKSKSNGNVNERGDRVPNEVESSSNMESCYQPGKILQSTSPSILQHRGASRLPFCASRMCQEDREELVDIKTSSNHQSLSNPVADLPVSSSHMKLKRFYETSNQCQFVPQTPENEDFNIFRDGFLLQPELSSTVAPSSCQDTH